MYGSRSRVHKGREGMAAGDSRRKLKNHNLKYKNKTITISIKRDDGLEGELGGIYGRVWRKKREGRSVVITLSSQKL